MEREGLSTGLSAAEAARRLERDGADRVPRGRRRSRVGEFAAQLTHLLAFVLWAAAVLALAAGMRALAVAIGVVVVLNAVFAFSQEHRADRSAEHLARLMPARCTVLRDGRVVTVAADDVVVGDLVRLAPGDRVPADVTLVSASELRLDESMTTGESASVGHHPGDSVLAGTFVVQGEGESIIAATKRVRARNGRPRST